MFFRKRPFVHKMLVHKIFVPLNPPPPNQQTDGFPLEFLLKGPQTELRTLSQDCEQTLEKLRTNRIMNKPGECLTPLVLTPERAFPTSDYWGRIGVARCAEEMTGICRDFK